MRLETGCKTPVHFFLILQVQFVMTKEEKQSVPISNLSSYCPLFHHHHRQ